MCDFAVQGGWASDLKQGLGKKVYANGDVYEGLWRQGKCEGPGRYRWKNNNEYDGEWKAGRMHGKGTLKWHTGESAWLRSMHAECFCMASCLWLLSSKKSAAFALGQGMSS